MKFYIGVPDYVGEWNDDECEDIIDDIQAACDAVKLCTRYGVIISASPSTWEYIITRESNNATYGRNGILKRWCNMKIIYNYCMKDGDIWICPEPAKF